MKIKNYFKDYNYNESVSSVMNARYVLDDGTKKSYLDLNIMNIPLYKGKMFNGKDEIKLEN